MAHKARGWFCLKQRKAFSGARAVGRFVDPQCGKYTHR